MELTDQQRDLLQRLSRHCREESIKRHQLLGWWLPMSVGALAIALGVFLPPALPFAGLLLVMMFVFHRYYRWRLRQLLQTPAGYLHAVVMDKRLINRGHRRSHGLMFPVEVRVTREASRLDQIEQVVTPTKQTLWLESSLLERLEDQQEIVALLIGDRTVPVVVDSKGIAVSPYLALPEGLRQALDAEPPQG